MVLDRNTVAEELGRANFEDRRLARRLRTVAERLTVNPALSFPKALNSSAELEAAYRFFGNPVVTPDRILSGHFDATRERCRAERCTLVIHDTTTVSFRPDGQRSGLGRLRKTTQSFFAHVALAIADDETRRPLGVAGMTTWVRDDEQDAPSEHARWGNLVTEAAERLVGAELIHVMDREADDYALFAQLVRGNHRFIIRSMHDRLLLGNEHDGRKLSQALATIEQAVERAASLSKRTASSAPKKRAIHPPRSSRVAKLAFGATSVVLKRPKPHPRYADQAQRLSLPESIRVNVIRVWELEPPADEPAVEWVLLTSDPIDTVEDIVRTIERYRARWTIEEYFKALKTGCAYESRQLEDYESLVNALAIFAPIACTLLALRSEARRAPGASALTVLTSTELDVLRALGRVPLSATPTARDALLAVAALGGHIKYNGEPGWLTLGRGYVELVLLTRGWEAAKLQQARDQS